MFLSFIMSVQKVCWGVAPIQSPSISYLFPLIKLKQMGEIKIVVLIADTEALAKGESLDLVKLKIEYYKFIIKYLMREVNINLENVEFVLTSSFHYKKIFVNDIYQLLKLFKNKIKFKNQVDLLQVFDAHYCNCDYQLGTTHQIDNFEFTNIVLKEFNYSPIINIIHEPILGLTETKKISTFDKNSRIDLYDIKEVISKKINKSEIDKKFENSGIPSIFKNIIFNLYEIKGQEIIIGNKTYKNYCELQQDFIEDTISEEDIKIFLLIALNTFISNTRKKIFQKRSFSKAYPDIFE